MSTILVVEDEGIIAEDIRRILLGFGYQVPKPLATGNDAITAVRANEPDLVLMDIQLRGELDGIETAARLRTFSDVPLIYLTAHSDELTLARAKATDPHGYVVKPFHERDLRVAIEVALHNSQLERRLAERERWFATTLDSLGEAIIATNSQGEITFVNPMAEALTGWSRAQAQGRPLGQVMRLVDEHGTAVVSPAGKPIREKFRIALPLNTRLFSRHGESLEVEDSATAIIDDRGRILGAVVIFRDITDRKKLERRLVLAERLASIGTMAAGTAHEINNPLAAIIGNVTFAMERLARLRKSFAGDVANTELEQACDALVDANAACERVRAIVRDLKMFARAGDKQERQTIDVSDALEVAIKLTDNQLRHNAALRRQYGTTPYVCADEGQLVQVFTNLLVNAAEAIGAGKASSNEIVVATSTDTSGNAVVEIRDTGCGMEPAVQRRVFDPFFSTKKLGDGMGLGLSICHGIIQGLGGEITVQSEPAKGTSFRVTLPAAAPKDMLRAAETQPPCVPTRRGRILVIDDDLAVSRTIERMLQDEHDVCVEIDPRHALERLSRDKHFDLILCDLMMPDVTGMDVHAALASSSPELVDRLVFLTGGAFSERASDFLRNTHNLTVAKPFNAEQLRTLVCEHLQH